MFCARRKIFRSYRPTRVSKAEISPPLAAATSKPSSSFTTVDGKGVRGCGAFNFEELINGFAPKRLAQVVRKCPKPRWCLSFRLGVGHALGSQNWNLRPSHCLLQKPASPDSLQISQMVTDNLPGTGFPCNP